MIRVRPYSNEDKEALRRFVRGVWPVRPDEMFDKRWWWRRTPPSLFLAVDDDAQRIVGMCAYIPFELHSDGNDERAAWFVDFFVSPDQQGKGIGKSLTREVMKTFPVTASLSQSDDAWATFRKLEWSERSYAKLYLHIAPKLWPGPRHHPDIAITSHPFDSNLAPEIAGQIDRLWLSARDAYKAIAVRDSATLNTRYARFEQRRYRLFLAHRDGEIVGYLISRVLPKKTLRSFHQSIGLVVDYLTINDNADAFSALLRSATTASLSAGARAMLCMSTHSGTSGVLTKAGYLHSGTPLIGRKLRALDVGFTCYGPVVPSNWFLTPGDCDLDMGWAETSPAA